MKVKCVDNYLMSAFLTVGKVYNVELVENRGYSIVDDSGSLYVYMKYRFVIVDNSPVETNYKKLRAVKSKFNGKKVVLGKNSDYIVVHESSNAYFIINDCGQIAKYSKSYFIELNKGER